MDRERQQDDPEPVQTLARWALGIASYLKQAVPGNQPGLQWQLNSPRWGACNHDSYLLAVATEALKHFSGHGSVRRRAR